MINLGHYTTAWNDGEIVYDCAFCSKGCNSFSSLVQHCKMTTLHAWCHQCERAFPSESAKEDHRKNSSRHYFCTICNTSGEYASYTELREHKIDQHNWCYTCDQYFPDFWTLRTHDYDRHYMCPNCDEFCGDSDGLRTHKEKQHHWCPNCDSYWPNAAALRAHDVEVHNMCDVCGVYFKNDNNLRMHEITHAPRNLECYGCYRNFPSFSAMLIHLESGNCESGTDKALLRELAFKCYLNKQYSHPSSEYFPFFCPGCGRDFPSLSGLFQHAEMRLDCERFLEHGFCLAKLRHFVRINI